MKKHNPQTEARMIWFTVAKLRDQKGDKAGAAQARQNAKILVRVRLKKR